MTLEIDNIGGNCPVQAEGTINGQPFYFRSRGQHWSMSIGGNDVIMAPDWYYEEPWGDEPFEAGWMPLETALELIKKCAAAHPDKPTPSTT